MDSSAASRCRTSRSQGRDIRDDGFEGVVLRESGQAGPGPSGLAGPAPPIPFGTGLPGDRWHGPEGRVEGRSPVSEPVPRPVPAGRTQAPRGRGAAAAPAPPSEPAPA
ncbi:hypothetical protein [Streptomyces sp. NPDC092307]|uniref:hypothetical protein n=1 Tax=Streptomyces sp. NPDC092307 TaxID=3366013 RepID=UPI00383088D8